MRSTVRSEDVDIYVALYILFLNKTPVVRDVNVFILLKNDRFVMKTTTKTIVFFKSSFFKKDHFKTVVNDDPLLTIVNETTNFIKMHATLLLVVLNEVYSCRGVKTP